MNRYIPQRDEKTGELFVPVQERGLAVLLLSADRGRILKLRNETTAECRNRGRWRKDLDTDTPGTLLGPTPPVERETLEMAIRYQLRLAVGRTHNNRSARKGVEFGGPEDSIGAASQSSTASMSFFGESSIEVRGQHWFGGAH